MNLNVGRTQSETEGYFLNLKPIRFQEMFQSASTEQRYLLDVRTLQEHKAGKIKGAELLDFHSFDFIEQLKKMDKDKLYFVYCRSGNRSGRALEMMKQVGFKKVVNLDGGFIQWHNEGLPFE